MTHDGLRIEQERQWWKELQQYCDNNDGANWVLNKYHQLDIAKSVMVEDSESLKNFGEK